MITWGMLLFFAVIVSGSMIGCTILIVSAMGRLMAGIARHNAHLESIRNSLVGTEVQCCEMTTTFKGLSNFYKRTEDDKRVG